MWRLFCRLTLQGVRLICFLPFFLVVFVGRTVFADPVSSSPADPSEPLLIWREGRYEVLDQERLQKAFELYLEQKPLSSAAVEARLARLHEAAQLLGGGVSASGNLGKAYRLLQQLAIDPLDDGSARELLTEVVRASTVLSRKQNLPGSEAALRKQEKILSWNLEIERRTARENSVTATPDAAQKKPGAAKTPSPSEQRLAQVLKEISRLELGTEVSELQARLEFQELALRLLERGDYPETVLAVRFYRGIFDDQLAPLRLGVEAKEQVVPSGATPGLGDIERLALQASEEINSRLAECSTLLVAHATGAAAKRLREAFALGSRSLEVLGFPWEARQEIGRRLAEEGKMRSLMAAKDYEAVLEILAKLQGDPSDGDVAALRSSIESARTLSSVHLSAARQAVRTGDFDAALRELKQSSDLWPRNPELAAASTEIAREGELQRQTLAEFDRLATAHQVREIERTRARFDTAFRALPVRQAQLQKALDAARQIREGEKEVNHLREGGNLVAAWEQSERLHREFPWDEGLQQLAGEARGVEDLARGIALARQKESGQPAVSLARYLTLRWRYPQSRLAGEGVHRLSSVLLGDK